ncbi:hypothetical protein M0802_007346 [Mischocyttarus mexicanus]|nr:hypothetical protein M0802_007346 [Mischocyttarus mexicanus]
MVLATRMGSPKERYETPMVPKMRGVPAWLSQFKTTNGLGLDPSSLWSLFTNAVSSGNQYLFNWLRYIFGSTSDQSNDMNVIMSTEMSMETDDLVCEGLYTFMSFGNEDYRKPISGNITPRDIRFSIKSL